MTSTTVPPAFTHALPLIRPRRASTSTSPSSLPVRCALSPPPPHSSRRNLAALALAALLVTTPLPPDAAHAIGFAPTPINPYAQRRSQKAYREYAAQLEHRLENVADLRKVVEAGGGGMNVSYRITGFAALVASAISTAILHPIDTIKTRLQARAARLSDPSVNIFDNLYNGVVSNIFKEAPNAAIYLAVYEMCKSFLTNLSFTSFFHDLPLITFMVAGALGDALGSVVRVPAEIVNKRLQLGTSSHWSDALRNAFFTSNGRRASMSAWQAVLLRDVPYGGVQIMLFEFGKITLKAHPHFLNGRFSHAGILVDVLVGAMAGSVAAMCTTPADVLVTRLSLADAAADPIVASPRAAGLSATARRIWIEEGIGGFFRGTLQRGAYYAPLIGLFFALYEFSRQSLAQPHALLASLHAMQIALETYYQAALPNVTGLMWLISEQLPLLLNLVSWNITTEL